MIQTYLSLVLALSAGENCMGQNLGSLFGGFGSDSEQRPTSPAGINILPYPYNPAETNNPISTTFPQFENIIPQFQQIITGQGQLPQFGADRPTNNFISSFLANILNQNRPQTTQSPADFTEISTSPTSSFETNPNLSNDDNAAQAQTTQTESEVDQVEKESVNTLDKLNNARSIFTILPFNDTSFPFYSQVNPLNMKDDEKTETDGKEMGKQDMKLFQSLSANTANSTLLSIVPLYTLFG